MRKMLQGVEIKDGDQGAVQAVFATLEVKDADGDVTLPGAFKNGAEVPVSSYGHRSWEGALPVGKGVIREIGKHAILDAEFFMDTQHGRDTFLTVKQLGELGEWSYGYDVVDYEMGEWDGEDVRFLKALDVLEVSPVLVGAGVGTTTLAAKTTTKGAIASHSTATATGPWDGPTMWTRLNSEAGPLRAATAWVDPDGDPDAKTSYKFIHHDVSADGDVGAANVMGCVAGCAVLNGGRGGTNIPDGDKRGVYNHLARHLRDAGREPPDFNPKQLPPPEHFERVLGDVYAALERAKSWGTGTEEAKSGRTLSRTNRELLQGLHSTGMAWLDDLRAFLDETDPDKQRRTLQTEFLRWQRHVAHL